MWCVLRNFMKTKNLFILVGSILLQSCSSNYVREELIENFKKSRSVEVSVPHHGRHTSGVSYNPHLGNFYRRAVESLAGKPYWQVIDGWWHQPVILNVIKGERFGYTGKIIEYLDFLDPRMGDVVFVSTPDKLGFRGEIFGKYHKGEAEFERLKRICKCDTLDDLKADWNEPLPFNFHELPNFK